MNSNNALHLLLCLLIILLPMQGMMKKNERELKLKGKIGASVFWGEDYSILVILREKKRDYSEQGIFTLLCDVHF